MTEQEKNQIDKLRREYFHMEVAARELAEKAYSARVLLDRLSGPAPSGGKQILSNEKAGKLVLDRRKTIARKTAAKKTAAVYTATVNN